MAASDTTAVADGEADVAWVEHLVAGATTRGKWAHTVSQAAYLTRPAAGVRALCCGCLEAHDAGRARVSLVYRVPRGGECEGCRYVGVDCVHSGDYAPGMRARRGGSALDLYNTLIDAFGSGAGRDGETYRDLAYVRGECERLAEQARAAL